VVFVEENPVRGMFLPHFEKDRQGLLTLKCPEKVEVEIETAMAWHVAKPMVKSNKKQTGYPPTVWPFQEGNDHTSDFFGPEKWKIHENPIFSRPRPKTPSICPEKAPCCISNALKPW